MSRKFILHNNNIEFFNDLVKKIIVKKKSGNISFFVSNAFVYFLEFKNYIQSIETFLE